MNRGEKRRGDTATPPTHRRVAAQSLRFDFSAAKMIASSH
jgi:hypothetical protein